MGVHGVGGAPSPSAWLASRPRSGAGPRFRHRWPDSLCAGAGSRLGGAVRGGTGGGADPPHGRSRRQPGLRRAGGAVGAPPLDPPPPVWPPLLPSQGEALAPPRCVGQQPGRLLARCPPLARLDPCPLRRCGLRGCPPPPALGGAPAVHRPLPGPREEAAAAQFRP